MSVNDRGHAQLVELYLQAAGFASVEVRRLREAWPTDPMTAVIGRK